jgi:hypothetical protein
MELAPEFLNSIMATGNKALSWARSMSEALIRELHTEKISMQVEYLEMSIGNYVTELHEKRKELVGEEHRIRRVYDQIRPSGGITQLQITEEKFKALELLLTFSKELDHLILGWESLLYAVKKRKISFEKAYAENSSKLTYQIMPRATERRMLPVQVATQETISPKQVDDSKSTLSDIEESLSAQTSEIDDLAISEIEDEDNNLILGMRKWQWIIILALGLGVALFYCVALLILLMRLMI